MRTGFGVVPCSSPGCPTFLYCDQRHVDNLIAASWTCPSHDIPTHAQTPGEMTR